MKITVNKPVEIEVTHIGVCLPVRFDEEDIPNEFPMHKGGMWTATIDIISGRILGWPATKSGEKFHMYMKVCDEGIYTLLNDGELVAVREREYVPCDAIPGEDGDYVDFEINHEGIIENWLTNPDLSCFFPGED